MTTENPVEPNGSASNESEIIVVNPYSASSTSIFSLKRPIFDDDDDSDDNDDLKSENEQVDGKANDESGTSNPSKRFKADDAEESKSDLDLEDPELEDSILINLEFPDATKAEKSEPAPTKTKIIAPSFDDVMEDPSEGALILERGGGRYFGFEDESYSELLICRRCGGKGHKAADCDTMVCINCGQKNDHTSRDCPKSKKCSRCGKVGHLRKDCREKEVRMFCRLCNSHIHTEENCLTIWRSYIVKKNAEVKYPTIISCYNCGGEGHYGDDCYEPRRIQLRFVEDSAFTGNLLPRKFQNRYYDNLSKQKHNYEAEQNRRAENSISRRDKRERNRKYEKDIRKGRSNGNNESNGSSGSWSNNGNNRNGNSRNGNGRYNNSGSYTEYQRYSGYGNRR